MYKITVESYFSAAHHLTEYKGNCEKIHGHNWKVLVTAAFKELPANGMAMDFRELKSIVERVLEKLDHTDINDHEYFKIKNPTSENIAEYIFNSVKKLGVPVESVTVFETDKYSATYTEEKYEIIKEI